MLSEAGRAEVGHIFPSGEVPVTQITPIWANLEGTDEGHVFLRVIDRLTMDQREK